MLRSIRIFLGVICLIAVTALFLDVTGSVYNWWGWLAKIQFMPAVLSLNIAVIAALIVLTLVLGRVYCSVICPMGVYQDVVNRIHCKISKKHRFTYSKPLAWLRILFLALFVILIILGLARIAAYIEPYSAYGRMVSSLLKPLYVEGNNLIADNVAADNYTFYHVDYYFSWAIAIVGIITFVVVTACAWVNGRIYCNTICPVGTILGYLSQWSLLKPYIDTSKCINCGKCARECKASCIDAKNHKIDYTRCVECMDCLGNCSKNAIVYGIPKKLSQLKSKQSDTDKPVDTGRREMLTVGALLAGSAILKAQDKTVDGGLAVILDKEKPVRKTRITPPGSLGHRNFTNQCTACQLCISNCPNNVLRPSADAEHFMQPEVSYERGYCRPECTNCSSVCPVGAIKPIDAAEKSSIQIGHAVWIKENCLAYSGEAACSGCARHCPVGAITMIPKNADEPDGIKIPLVDVERCIGCGACENLCPVRPFSAIYVEGHEQHRYI